MKDTLPAVDVVVVGGGLAGFTTAVRAAELGLRTLLLEKTTMDPSYCNSRLSGGAVHPCMLNIELPPQAIIQKLTESTAGTARPDLVKAFAEGALPALRWLQEQGLSFIAGGTEDYQRYLMNPPMPNRVTADWQGYGPDVNLRILKARFLRLGGLYRNGHRCAELVVEGGPVRGLIAETPGGEKAEARAGAVVLADGGFQANRDMVKRYITPHADRIKLRGTDSGTGDGIRMGLAVGAKLVGMDTFYGHTVSIDGLRDAALGMFPTLDHLISASIVVRKANGRRFLDEGSGGVKITNLLAKSEDPQGAVVVFDDEMWAGPGSEKKIAPNPNLTLAGGTFYSGENLEDLAHQAGIDAEGLHQTVEEYNRAIAGDAQGLAVRRSGKARPLARQPYHAIPIVPGITYTMGGLLINSKAQVLDEREEPIPGLWAAGVTTGGLEGGPKCAYAGGLLQSAVFGKAAAEHIQAVVKSR